MRRPHGGRVDIRGRDNNGRVSRAACNCWRARCNRDLLGCPDGRSCPRLRGHWSCGCRLSPRRGVCRSRGWLGMSVRRVRRHLSRRLRSGRAVKVDAMNVHIAFAELAVLRKRELNRNRITTLFVGNVNSGWRAPSQLATFRTVCHLIVEDDHGIPRGGKVEVADGKRRLSSFHLDSIVIVARKLCLDALALFLV